VLPWMGLIGALFTTAVFSITDADLLLQNHLYLQDAGRWLWDRQEPVSKTVLYSGFKTALHWFNG